MLEKVYKFNNLIGNHKGDLSAPDWVKLEAQAKLIVEEAEELLEAAQLGDIKAVRKELCDCFVTAGGFSHLSGVDIEKDMEVVNCSNLTKFCLTTEQVVRSQVMFRENNVLVTQVSNDGKSIGFISTVNQTGEDGKFYQKGKLLKPWHFKEGKLDD